MAVDVVGCRVGGAIAPGGWVSIGFQADHTGSTAGWTSFTLDSAACGVA